MNTTTTSSVTTTGGGCPDDLLVLQRRGTLTPENERTLAAHVAVCPLCRLSAGIGAAIEPLPELAVENDLLVARLVTGALALVAAETPIAKAATPVSAATPSRIGDRATRRRSTRAVPRWAVAAAFLLSAGTAGATLWRFASPQHDWPWSRWRPPAPAAPAHQRRAPGHDVAPGADVAPAVPDAPEPPATPVAPAAPSGDGTSSAPGQPASSPKDRPPARLEAYRQASPTGGGRAASPQGRASAPAGRPAPPIDSAPAPPEETRAQAPADLFAAAAQARRARDLDGAIQRYRQLQSAFPTSPEARLSFLSLGDLLFARGAYAAALQQLDGYLRSGETESLEEALLGRARALAALGRRADERAAWQTLLDRFPQSDYRWRAQQRLSVLDGPADSVP